MCTASGRHLLLHLLYSSPTILGPNLLTISVVDLTILDPILLHLLTQDSLGVCPLIHHLLSSI